MLEIREVIVKYHDSLFIHLVDNFINKVDLFGLYFASLDIRQDSSVHSHLLEVISEHTNLLPDNYKELSEEEKINTLLAIDKTVSPSRMSFSGISWKPFRPLKPSSSLMGRKVATAILSAIPPLR